MKKTISILLSVCMLLSMVCSLYVPAEATQVYHVRSPHTEILLETEGNAPIFFTFTVDMSGYYIVQTMGFESGDEENPLPKGSVESIFLVGSDYIPGGYCDEDTGYDINRFMSCSLDAGRQYTLRINLSSGTSHCRLVITYAEEHYVNDDYPLQNYSNIRKYDFRDNQTDFSLDFTFTSENISKAQISTLTYIQSIEDGEWRMYDAVIDINYNCEVNVYLLDPRSLSQVYYTDPPSYFDLSDGAPVYLDYDVPYYLVVYFDWIDSDTVLDGSIIVTVNFE